MENENMEEEINNNEEVQEVEQNDTVDTEDVSNESTEELEVQKEDVKQEDTDNQKEINRIVESRLKRAERKHEKENQEFYEIEDILKQGLGVENRQDIIKSLRDFYGEKVQENPVRSINERDERVLARADANEIIDLGFNEMESEANRIASIPESDRTLREQEVFNILCEKMIEEKQLNELKNKGIKSEILEDKNFKEFKDKFNYNTPISDIYEMYSKLNAKPVEKPASAGSAKSQNNDSGEVFSVERINQMKPEEILKYWENPAFRKTAGLN